MQLSEVSLGYKHVHLHNQEEAVFGGPVDLLMAAQAMSRGLVLITNNETGFRRVEGLEIENWATD
jgi:predicted nucleic acid-binding protein